MTSSLELALAATNLPLGEARDLLLSEARTESLRERIRACTACPLHDSVRSPVPWEGKADIAIIGEAPGSTEDNLGRPFVGRAGILLTDLLRSAGWDRSRIAFINTICCRPPRNDFDEAIKADAPARCRPLFWDQVAASGAWLLIPVGNVALRSLLPDAGGITNHRGKFYWVDHHLVFPTFHPAYALRNPEAKTQILSDLMAARRIAQDVALAPVPKGYDPSKLLGSMRDTEFTYTESATLASHFKRKGWVLAYSKWLEDSIILKRDEATRVPASAQGVEYTVGELVQLSKWTSRNWEDARRLHLAKKEFGGVIL